MPCCGGVVVKFSLMLGAFLGNCTCFEMVGLTVGLKFLVSITCTVLLVLLSSIFPDGPVVNRLTLF